MPLDEFRPILAMLSDFLILGLNWSLTCEVNGNSSYCDSNQKKEEYTTKSHPEALFAHFRL